MTGDSLTTGPDPVAEDIGRSVQAEVKVSIEVGWPRCKAIAQTKMPDGKIIAQVGLASSKHYGTQTASSMAKDQSLARLKLAVQIYKAQKENTKSPIVTPEDVINAG